jgi:hypothetical protein
LVSGQSGQWIRYRFSDPLPKPCEQMRDSRVDQDHRN